MRILLLTAVLYLAVMPSTSAALPPLRASLVKDVDPSPINRGSSPQHFRTLGGRVYFAASAVDTGEEVYSTDAQGNLRLLANIAAGPDGSSPEPVAVVGDRVIVSADDRVAGRQLWSISTEGGSPQRLTSLGDTWVWPPGTAEEVVALPGRALLRLVGQGYGVWSTDGTPQGTFALPQDAGFPLSVVYDGCAVNGSAVVAGAGDGGMRLAKTNGLPGGGSVLASLPDDAYVVDSAAAAGYCYFLYTRQGGGWLLWRSDGTPAGTVQFAASTTGIATALVAQGTDLYFTGNSTAHATWLQRVAAGAAAPQPLVELPGPLDTNGWLIAHRGFVLFQAFSGSAGSFVPSIYISDGTAAGTRRLFSSSSGQVPSTAQSVYPVGDAIVLASSGDATRIVLADGNVSTITPTSLNFYDSALLGDVRIGGGSTFAEREVWLSDGTAAGTRRLHDIWPETQGGLSGVESWTAIGDTLYFTPGRSPDGSGVVRSAVWRTDGTEAGTQPLPSSLLGDWLPRRVLAYAGSGVMIAADYSLYYADAALTSAMPVVPLFGHTWMQGYGGGRGVIYVCGDTFGLCGIDPATGGTTLSSEIFFRAESIGEIGGVAILWRDVHNDIWRSDGTLAGTFRLLEGRQILSRLDASQDAVLGGKLYFVACTPSYACDLFATDGSVGGTVAVRPVPIGSMYGAARAGSHLVFTLGFGSAGQLWSTDGSASGTVLLLDSAISRLAGAGGHVHLYAQCNTCKQRYIVTDGTPIGTRAVELPGALTATPYFIAAIDDDSVVFSCENTRRGNELCQSSADGREIAALPEIYPGGSSATPFFLGRTPAAVYFSAEDGAHGREPWQIRRLPEALFADGFD
ncbi:hypothetical protein [Tahibacter sp.]|uniref:hypothetical protein n=1 Tax=Tahibacter sp. TaxID=2056211 RepID=UPI0028C3A33B|nr:hypothetical protein [Tahibacter sp.]